MFGLNLASVRNDTESDAQVDYLLSVDRSSVLGLFWDRLKEIVQKSQREETIRTIHEFILNNAAAFFPKECACCRNKYAQMYIRGNENEIQKGTSWLSNDKRYERIQKIFNANRFAFVRADLYDPNVMERISDTLKSKTLTLDGIYLSNVREYAESDGRLDSFQRAQGMLKASCTSETFVVDTKVREGGLRHVEELRQQFRLGFRDSSESDFFPRSPEHHCQPVSQIPLPIGNLLGLNMPLNSLLGNVVILNTASLPVDLNQTVIASPGGFPLMGGQMIMMMAPLGFLPMGQILMGGAANALNQGNVPTASSNDTDSTAPNSLGNM